MRQPNPIQKFHIFTFLHAYANINIDEPWLDVFFSTSLIHTNIRRGSKWFSKTFLNQTLNFLNCPAHFPHKTRSPKQRECPAWFNHICRQYMRLFDFSDAESKTRLLLLLTLYSFTFSCCRFLLGGWIALNCKIIQWSLVYTISRRSPLVLRMWMTEGWGGEKRDSLHRHLPDLWRRFVASCLGPRVPARISVSPRRVPWHRGSHWRHGHRKCRYVSALKTVRWRSRHHTQAWWMAFENHAANVGQIKAAERRAAPLLFFALVVK